MWSLDSCHLMTHLMRVSFYSNNILKPMQGVRIAMELASNMTNIPTIHRTKVKFPDFFALVEIPGSVLHYTVVHDPNVLRTQHSDDKS